MLGAFKGFIKALLVPVLYVGAFGVMLVAMFKEVKWGLLLLVFLIPQPNIFYKFQDYPFGKDILDFLFVATCFGIAIQKKKLPRSSNATIILLLALYTYISLWNSSLRFSLPLPITLANELLYDYKNYFQMLMLYFLAYSIIDDEHKERIFVYLIVVVILFIAIRCYRNFSAGAMFRYDKRIEGPFYAAGLGANHLAAFFAHYWAVVLGLFLFEKEKRPKMFYLATLILSLHPLFFTYSRGAYLATATVIGFFGVIGKRSLLVLLLVLVFSWATLLPSSVVDRIQMTTTEDGEIEHSAAGRLDLWEFAYQKFIENPILGIGFGGYPLAVGGLKTSSGGTIRQGFDTHSLWMKTLAEQGAIGFSLLALVLLKALTSGWQLYRLGASPFHKGLGFGFMGCVIANIVTNIFGDRWSYFVLGGYFWILWGLVDRCIVTCKVEKAKT